MIVLYKICFNKNRCNRDISIKKRPFFEDYNSLIKKCLCSLVRQLTSQDEIRFFLDGDDPDNLIKDICEQYSVNYTIFKFNHQSAPKMHAQCSMHLLNELNECEDLDHIFICEDDYLFYDNALEKIKDFLTMYPKFFCHPIDYPNLYTKQKYPSDIIITNTHHWRSIKTTTYTFAFTYLKFKQHTSLFCNSNEELFWRHLCNLMYVESKCFSPIPSLCAHIENDCLPPFFDKKSLC